MSIHDDASVPEVRPKGPMPRLISAEPDKYIIEFDSGDMKNFLTALEVTAYFKGAMAGSVMGISTAYWRELYDLWSSFWDSVPEEDK